MTAADELKTVEDFDQEIAALQRERERLVWLRTDPEQRRAREARRDQVLGRWLRGRGLALTAAHLDEIRVVGGDGDGWLVDADWLGADGWVADDDGGWTAPPGG